MHFLPVSCLILIWLPSCHPTGDEEEQAPIVPGNPQLETKFQEIVERIRKIEEESRNHCKYFGTREKDEMNFDDAYPQQTLTHHMVCYEDPNINERRKRYVKATIRHENLPRKVKKIVEGKEIEATRYQGTDVSKDSAAIIREVRNHCGCDDAGHVIARSLGGLGEPFNIYPQHRSLNSGNWAKVESLIRTHLKLSENNGAQMLVAFDYDHSNTMRDGEERETSIKEAVGELLNEDHTDAEPMKWYEYNVPFDPIPHFLSHVGKIENIVSQNCRLTQS